MEIYRGRSSEGEFMCVCTRVEKPSPSSVYEPQRTVNSKQSRREFTYVTRSVGETSICRVEEKMCVCQYCYL